jgi:hypothetical protein
MTHEVTLIDRLKDSYSFLGDPLHREAYEELERLEMIIDQQQEVIENLTDRAYDIWGVGSIALREENEK